MIKRTLFFNSPYALSLKQKQLCVKNLNGEQVSTIPIEDLGYVVIENQQIQLSIPLIEALSVQNVATIFCGRNHMPNSMLLPLEVHSTQHERYKQQIAATEPLKKGIWKQIIEYKIKNQATLLDCQGYPTPILHELIKRVKSGDTSNEEAKAARIYWGKWRTILNNQEFTRHRYGIFPNDLLNYGYAILRAAVARALSGSGLFPSFGLFHRNKYNAFCLADDVMEPYRPFIDQKVLEIVMQHGLTELNTEAKTLLLNTLAEDAYFKDTRKPFMLGLSKTTSSLQECFAGKRKKIIYPTLCD